MNQAQIGASQMEGDRAISDLYRKITYYGQREGRVVRRTKWNFYQNCTKSTSGVAMADWKNPVVIVRLRGGLEES